MLIFALIACKATRRSDDGTPDSSATDTGVESATDSGATDDSAPPAGDPVSLRFYGTGKGNQDRVRIPLDPGGGSPAVDVGADNFMVEFFVNGLVGDNSAVEQDCSEADWRRGNVVVDSTWHDGTGQTPGYGVSLAGGQVLFHVNILGKTETICGQRDVLDGSWHHVAVGRRAKDGQLWLLSDGLIEVVTYGPDGDLSYPDGQAAGTECGQGADQECVNDPYLVLGAEAHDTGPPFPSFNGTIDEVRISSTLRYDSPYEVPTRAFQVDGETVGLFHLDEASGEVAENAAGGENGELLIGGNPEGPEWVTESPFE